MAGVKRSQLTEQYKQDSYKYFWEAYPEMPPKYALIFEVVPSNAAYEQFTSAVGLGELLEKPEGEDLQSDAPMESYTIICANRSWGRLVRFSYESVQDSQKFGNLLRETVGSWGKNIPITKEKFYAKFFNKGAFTAGDEVFNNNITGVVSGDTGKTAIYDNTTFFSNSHQDKVGNTYDNLTANALSVANLKSGYETYTQTNNRDERGQIFDLEPDVLLIPPALKFTAQEILNSALVPFVTNNTTNVLNSILTPMAWPYLTDTDAWFIGKLKNGLMATDREGISLDFWQDEISMDYFARSFTRFGGAVTNWRFWLGNGCNTS